MPFELEAVARNGERCTWSAELEQDEAAGQWTYRVSDAACDDFYEARFREVADHRLQPDVLDRHHEFYRGKGLTEALFERVVADTGRTLISSTNDGAKNLQNEYRTTSADRVWWRLFGEDRARYDAQTDRFTFFPQGLPRGGGIRRVGALHRPRFYIKGSYVLDAIFHTEHANDVDVCWLDTGGQPSVARVEDWMRLCALPPKPIQLVRVTDSFACDGGGAPIFNIDLWRIEMDGRVYGMNPETHEARPLREPYGPLDFLADLDPVELGPSEALNAVLHKALAKMARHAPLFSQATTDRVNALLARPLP